MSTTLSPFRPPTSAAGTGFARRPGRIVERTTTITREIFLDDPLPALTGPRTRHGSGEPVDAETNATATPARRLRGFDRTLVSLGVWFIELGRRRALHPPRSADEIASELDAAKAHDMRHFIGLPS